MEFDPIHPTVRGVAVFVGRCKEPAAPPAWTGGRPPLDVACGGAGLCRTPVPDTASVIDRAEEGGRGL